MKPIRFVVVESTIHPGELSIRLKPGDPTWTPFVRALKAAGAKPGDILECKPVDDGHEEKMRYLGGPRE